jgi:hypothetical protein
MPGQTDAFINSITQYRILEAPIKVNDTDGTEGLFRHNIQNKNMPFVQNATFYFTA